MNSSLSCCVHWLNMLRNTLDIEICVVNCLAIYLPDDCIALDLDFLQHSVHGECGFSELFYVCVYSAWSQRDSMNLPVCVRMLRVAPGTKPVAVSVVFYFVLAC